jgi:hypothetical protein
MTFPEGRNKKARDQSSLKDTTRNKNPHPARYVPARRRIGEKCPQAQSCFPEKKLKKGMGSHTPDCNGSSITSFLPITIRPGMLFWDPEEPAGTKT